jgi:hypothetical protein
VWSAAKVFAGSPAINKQILMSSSAAGQWHFCSRPSPSVSLAYHDNGFGVVCRSIRWVQRSRAVQPNPNPGGWDLWYFLPSQGWGMKYPLAGESFHHESKRNEICSCTQTAAFQTNSFC